MRRGSIAALILALATLAVLLAPQNERLWRGRAGAETTITITVWGQPFEDRLFKDVYARGYERRRPSIRVAYQRHSDLWAKYAAWHAQGWGPEVMRVRITDYHVYVAQGMLEPMDAYIAHPEFGLSESQLAQFPPELIETLHVDGKIFALPQDTAQFGLYYNRAIFDAWNAANPHDPVTYPDDSWTWQELREAAAKLTRRDPATGSLEVAGFDMFIWEWPFMHFFLQAGGELWDRDQTTVLIASRAGVQALMFLAALVEDGSWQPYFSQFGGMGPDARFASGRTAMYLDGSWKAPDFEIRAPNLDFAIAPPPRGRSPRSIAGSVVWAISSRSRNKLEGWRMIRWLTDHPQALAYWEMLRVAPPAHLGVVSSPAFRSTAGIPAPGRPGEYLVPPMPEERFEDRARWLVYQMSPHPETGAAPATIPASRYQAKLELEIRELLQHWLENPHLATPSHAGELLSNAAANVHRHIDRDRRSRGLAGVER